MKILGFEIKRSEVSSVKPEQEIVQPEQEIYHSDKRASAYYDTGTIIPLGSTVLNFDGERNIGEMGPAVNYIPNYYLLATRSWQAYLDAPLAKSMIDKWIGWILDSGLKIKTNPSKIVLKTEGIVLDSANTETFNDIVESRWDIWSNSKNSSFSGEETFNELSKSVYLNSKIAGDCLVIIRYENEIVKIQYIDGARVANPSLAAMRRENGNIVSNGVELSPTGKVIGYHVKKTDTLEFDFVSAYSPSTGLRTAFLVKGSKWRINYHRGLPVVATVLETMSKIDRYREATVGSAEEVANVAYQVVHQNFSDGSNPLQQNLAKAFGGGDSAGTPQDADGDAFARNVAITTKKAAVNNPKGAKIETLNQSNNVQGFDTFYSTNANIICSAVGIPPNVAMSVYNDSFSASRAATKDWDHTMDVEREDFTKQFFIYVYKFWLYTEILNNKVQAPGYLQAFNKQNFMITESYEKMRFTGPHFPHIDPLKEVKAEREKLGGLGKNIPLTTVEHATEALGCGDSDSNMEQFSDELKASEGKGLVERPKPIPEPVNPVNVP